MIFHEEDYNKANIILLIDNQCGLQALFSYIFIDTFNQMQFYHIVLKSNSIYTDTGMSTSNIYLLNLFKHPITSWLGTTPYFIINNISEIKTIDQCR
ncbi:unnamed protein product [Adineta steineri]|uniref:Uncharacterized protein n=1 Tax=Adineta steineri TaxID=433720 RepID=A0A816F1Q9_9BILA|nr:unnamed protein product [Adineta steineri]CAF1654840.1 unnamed protein product [Adineta steineri]